MRIRRALFDLLIEIITRDQLSPTAVGHICNTSRQRASGLLRGSIEIFNSETLIDMLWRFGVDLDVSVTGRMPYARWTFTNPRPGWEQPRYIRADE